MTRPTRGRRRRMNNKRRKENLIPIASELAGPQGGRSQSNDALLKVSFD